MSRVLIIGNLFYDKWVGALIRNVKAYDPSIKIDLFNEAYRVNPKSDAALLCENVIRYKRYYPMFLYIIPKFRKYLVEKDSRLSLKKWMEKCRKKGIIYDVVNFHYLNNRSLDLWAVINPVAKLTVITPWGSDVLRASENDLKILKENARHYNKIIISDNERYNRQIKSIFGPEDNRYIKLGFGVEVIDNLVQRLHIDKNEAKDKLGLSGQYVIEIGYNGSPAQNHIKVIDAILQAKDELPDNITLVVPMTYGLTEDYKREVIGKLDATKLPYQIYADYLSMDDVFYLRRSADMFIHAQNTDANSASLAEYMICRTTIVNAVWLRYEGREYFGKPYYEFENFNTLASVIVEAYTGGTLVNELLVEDLKKMGWQYKAKEWVSLYNGIKEE